jgi:hypothetical protein
VPQKAPNNAPDLLSSLLWQVGKKLEPGTLFHFKLQSPPETGPAVYSGTFSIVSGGSVTSPRRGDVWRGGENRDVTWAGFNGAEVEVELCRGDDTPGTIIARATPNDGSCTWTVPAGLVGLNFYVKVTATTDPTSVVRSEPFEIAAQGITNPRHGEVLRAGESHVVSWSGFGSTQVSLELHRGTFQQGVITPTATIDNSGSFTWQVPLDRVGWGTDADFHIVV